MTKIDALNILYNATRQIQTTAENHEKLREAAEFLAKALEEKEVKDDK